ncbi:MAG: glycoside hydrolase family 71/99-like protein [Verrucomicrobiota bacterium]
MEGEVYPAADGLEGKVFTGYQGWYRTPTDGSGLGWEHYETYSETFESGQVGIDYWPDVDELGEATLYDTPFLHADGSTAKVFSSADPVVADIHLQWMKTYGIDGLFLQRFTVDVVGFHHQSDLLNPSNNLVLENIRSAANKYQRAFALMYDLSGMPKGEMQRVMDDWKELNDELDLLHHPSYLRDQGRPVVAIWGVGFSDGRKYDLEDVRELIDFFKHDPDYGGCSIVLGVPTYWRSLDRDTVSDPSFHELIKEVDVVLPWYVGRFGGSERAFELEDELYGPDAAWCKENGLGYLPVIFPGFSWANRYAHENRPFDHIPREDGLFLWAQAVSAKRGGAEMLYIAMFDEMDEGTQIFKVTNDPPAGKSRFLTYQPHDADYYLKLAGKIGELMRESIEPGNDLPQVD